jgi:hypothetical protein
MTLGWEIAIGSQLKLKSGKGDPVSTDLARHPLI